MRPSIKFRSRHRVHEANVAADANSVGKVRALRAGQVQTVVTPMIAGSPQACKLFRRCASNAMSRRLLHSLGSNQRRGVKDQDDSHFAVNGNLATMNSTRPAWAARRWFSRPASSGNARPSGVSGTMPRPISLLTRIVSAVRLSRAAPKGRGWQPLGWPRIWNR